MLQMLQNSSFNKNKKPFLVTFPFFIYLPSACRFLIPKSFLQRFFTLFLGSSSFSFFYCGFSDFTLFQEAIKVLVSKYLILPLGCIYKRQFFSLDFVKKNFLQPRNFFFFNNLLLHRLTSLQNYGKFR